MATVEAFVRRHRLAAFYLLGGALALASVVTSVVTERVRHGAVAKPAPALVGAEE